MDSSREEVQPQGGVLHSLRTSEKRNGVETSEVVAVGRMEELGDADLRGVTGAGRCRTRQGVEKTEKG